MTLEQHPSSGQRQRLITLLRETYHDDWQALLKDFEPEGAQSFEELCQHGMLYLRPGSNGIQTYRRFLALMAQRYFSLVREIVRNYDHRALILGDRCQSFFYPEVARACAEHVDATSANLNAAWSDGTFPRFFLDTFHALTAKPVFVSEFYMAANQNRSGNRNDQGVFPIVATQRERALGFQNTVRALLRLPFVVGADWFQYYDEPTQGRYDGENFNFGLVDIHDRPYELLTATASGLDLISLKSQPHSMRPDASLGVPPAPVNPLGQFAPMLALKRWDRERGFVPPISNFPVADLYACWNAKALYLGLYAQDIPEDDYYRDKHVPEIDRAQWLIDVGGYQKPIFIRLGNGTRPDSDGTGSSFAKLSVIHLKTYCVAAVGLPAKLFGKTKFKAGDPIELTCTFLGHSRYERVDWKGRLVLSK